MLSQSPKKISPGRRSLNLINTTEVNSKQLRDYGFLMGAAVAVIFGLYPRFVLKQEWMIWPFLVLGIFWAVSVIYPTLLSPFYRLWMFIGGILGKINSTIILTICFFVLFVPVAFYFRLIHRDRLRRLKSNRENYRKSREQVFSPDQMEHPF